MAYGFLGFVGLAKETGWGSGVAATDFIEALSEDVNLTIERFGHKVMIASMAEPDDALGLYRVAGNLRFSGQPRALGFALKAALHSYTQSTVLSGFLHSHAFVTTSGGADFSSEVPIQPYTLEVFRDVTSSHRYEGMVCNALTMNFGQGAMMVDTEWIGRSTSVVARSTPTFVSSPNKPFTFDTVSLGLGGAGNALIETLSIGIKNNLQGFGALNLSQYIAKVRRTDHQMVEVNGTIDFANLTEYANFRDQTEQRLTVSVTKAASFSLVVDLPRLVYTTFPMGVSDRGRQLVSFTGKAFIHPGSLNAIKVTLIDTRSSYA